MTTPTQEQALSTAWSAEQEARQFAERNATAPWLAKAAGATAMAEIAPRKPDVYNTADAIREQFSAEYEAENCNGSDY